MPKAALQQLIGSEAGELFMRFPMPLAMIDSRGQVQVNASFSSLFDSACLDSPSVRSLMESGHLGWQPLRITAADGRQVEIHGQSITMPQGNMLVLGDSDAVMHDAKLDNLRRRVAELEKTSATDHLTGAWNRAHLVRVITTEIARSVRFRQPLSALLIDIDHFKRINDSHGHQAGDAVLCELVSLIQQKIRSADLLFRWGGEEFFVLAASTGHRDAETLAEHLRARVAGHRFPVVGALTISVGVAEHGGDETAEQWFNRLDGALYAAKDSGRNRVVAEACGDSDKWLTEGGLTALRLVWRDEYDCGEPQIDAEHRKLFDLANALIAEATAAGGQASATADAALADLIMHLEQHFSHEEAILAAHRYERLEEHQQAHAGLLRKAAELRAAAAGGQAGLGALVDFLATDVVARHLFTADRHFFPLFRDPPH